MQIRMEIFFISSTVTYPKDRKVIFHFGEGPLTAQGQILSGRRRLVMMLCQKFSILLRAFYKTQTIRHGSALILPCLIPENFLLTSRRWVCLSGRSVLST